MSRAAERRARARENHVLHTRAADKFEVKVLNEYVSLTVLPPRLQTQRACGVLIGVVLQMLLAALILVIAFPWFFSGFWL